VSDTKTNTNTRQTFWFNSLGIKSVLVVIVIVVISTSWLSYTTINNQNAQLETHLEEKIRALGHYISLVIPEDILAYDYESLNDSMREVTQEKDIVYGIVTALNGQNMTSFLPESDPYIEQVLKNSPDAEILEVIMIVKQHPDIIHREFPVMFDNKHYATLQLGVTRQHVNNISASIVKTQFLYAAMIILLLGCAIYLVLVRQVLHPVNKLMNAFGELGEGQVPDEVSIDTNNEFQSLGNSYNMMVSKLQHSLDALVRARDEAESANHAKSDFLSRMSHELRTPMNAILGFSQLLSMEELTDEQKSCVKHILTAGNHLLGLITEILEIHRIERGHIKINLETIRLHEVLDECSNMLSDMAAKHNVKLVMTYDTTQAGPGVLVDKQRLRQVIINLISNAIKYNQDPGRVTIHYELFGSKVQLHVTDTGIGIDASELEKIFLPFERSNSIAHHIEGVGIGLALCKSLIEHMQGTIHVDSTLGSGSDFMIELPLSAEYEAAYLTDQILPLALVDERIVSANHHMVLYIEDNPQNFILVKKIFKHWENIDLINAETGRRGIELAINGVPDLILLDIHLPDINGDEVFAQLQSNETTRNIPVVVVSADVMPGIIDKMQNMGIHGYLAKPLEIDKLIDIVERTINPDHDNHTNI